MPGIGTFWGDFRAFFKKSGREVRGVKRVYVNEKWCLGCHLCEYYCAFAGTDEKDMARALKEIKINPKIRIEEKGDVCFAVSCRHCREPLCVKACLTGALTLAEGVITINRDKCVSCYTCILVCPFGAVYPSEDGAVEKCELCIRTAEETPACARGCPNGAIVFEERGV